jgi:hypothetical protein
LAGALARRVWVAIPFSCDWRWLLERSDSPWYPSMRLFRQPQPGDWGSVFCRLQDALQVIDLRQNPEAPALQDAVVSEGRIGAMAKPNDFNGVYR